MALPDLTGQNIQNTYQRVLQTDGINVLNGTGSLFIPPTASYAETASYAISASHEIIKEVSSSYAETASYANGFAIEGNIVPNTHLASNLGSDDNYFLTASVGHVRTFDSTIEFVDPTTKATKGTLQFTGTNGLEVKDSLNVLTTISASKVRVTEKLEANNILFSGTLIGTIIGGTF